MRPACARLSHVADGPRSQIDGAQSLQGKIWKAGFESGELKGTLFADVPECVCALG